MTTTFARQERAALCDLALEVGPDAPTRCGEWNAKELVIHLLVRERSLLGSPGMLIPGLSGFTDRAMDDLAPEPFEELVERLRRPSPLLLVPGTDVLVNSVEFFVHHEDLRRARPDWTPRDISAASSGLLWGAARLLGPGLVRPAGVPVRLVRAGTGATATIRRGDDPVTVTGVPAELVMMLYNRPTKGLAYDGPAGRVDALRAADLGI